MKWAVAIILLFVPLAVVIALLFWFGHWIGAIT